MRTDSSIALHPMSTGGEPRIVLSDLSNTSGGNDGLLYFLGSTESGGRSLLNADKMRA
jgi:hypothetical protein